MGAFYVCLIIFFYSLIIGLLCVYLKNIIYIFFNGCLLCMFNYLNFKLHQLLSFLVKLVLCLLIISIQVGPLMNISHYRPYLQQLFKIYYYLINWRLLFR